MRRTGLEVPLVITVAPTGAEVTREDNPNVPYTPAELAREVERCWQEGASVCHLHIRENDGTPSARVEIWREAVQRIRDAVPVIVNVSTGGAITMDAEERLTGLEVQPEMASLTAGTTNFGEGVFFNPLPLVRRFAREMRARGIRPEVEVFDVGMVANALRLVAEGEIEAPPHFNIMMGVPGAVAALPEHLMHIVRSLPDDASWSVGGVGRFQKQMAALAIALGGHVRVGFEDNVKLSRSELATSNADFVRWVRELAQAFGRSVASPVQAREILGVRSAPVAP